MEQVAQGGSGDIIHGSVEITCETWHFETQFSDHSDVGLMIWHDTGGLFDKGEEFVLKLKVARKEVASLEPGPKCWGCLS